jgi:two-component system, NarL family, sensor histidine kinase UhpB
MTRPATFWFGRRARDAEHDAIAGLGILPPGGWPSFTARGAGVVFRETPGLAMTTATLARRIATPENLDLKRSLTLRVVAVALLCFFVAAALALFGTYRDARQANETLADIIGRQLQVQFFRIDANLEPPAKFPNLEPAMDGVLGAGQCVRFFKPDGSFVRSNCVGFSRYNQQLPDWFLWLGAKVLGSRADVERQVVYRGKAYGTLAVTTETDAVLAALWKDVSGMLGLTALLIAAICALQYVAIGRALRPTRDILAGLDRLSRGDLSCRLPSFRLIELQRISEVFNALAANLDRTIRERTALAARLVESHEQERSHLARELHDELAQALSAISAQAASIKTTAASDCPALTAEADHLLQTSMATMKSLRATLQTLRPPEINDFGLAASLLSLAREQERLAGGNLKIMLNVDRDAEALASSAASHIYRMVQEGLTNIGKHAQASRAQVSLDIRPEPPENAASRRRMLVLTIEDNGRGAGTHAAASGDSGAGLGLGLIGMRERAAALGGQLDIVRLDQGFRLQAMIPVEAEAEAAE